MDALPLLITFNNACDVAHGMKELEHSQDTRVQMGQTLRLHCHFSCSCSSLFCRPSTSSLFLLILVKLAKVQNSPCAADVYSQL